MKMNFTPAEQGCILRGLSDLESGNTRQWFWLEAASTLPAGMPTLRVRLLLLALRCCGPARLLPLLHRCGIPAMALYQAGHQARIERWQSVLNDALLGIGATLAICAGFGWLAASSQFAVWLACCGALLIASWRTLRSQPPAAGEFDENDLLPGAEASIGLTAMLLARGCPAGTASRLVHLLRESPDTALPLLAAALPELAEAPMHGKWLRWRTMLITWAGISLIITKINGFTPIPYNYLVSFLLLLGLALLARAHRSQLLILLATWCCAGLAAWLLRLV